jgi:hypothetical protein
MVILPSLKAKALFSITFPLPICALAFRINIDFDCFGEAFVVHLQVPINLMPILVYICVYSFVCNFLDN